MFKFLKKKLTDAVSAFSKKVSDEGKEESPDNEAPQPVEKAGTKEKIVEHKKDEPQQKKPKKEETKEKEQKPTKSQDIKDKSVIKEEEAGTHKQKPEDKESKTVSKKAEEKEKKPKEPVPKEEIPQEKPKSAQKKPDSVQEEAKDDAQASMQEPEDDKKGGFFSRIQSSFTKKKITMEQFEDMFFELEVVLLENNVAVEVIDKIKHDLAQELVDNPLPRNKIKDTIINSLKKSITELFETEDFDLVHAVKNSGEPYKILFAGVNGSGKTTTIAKIASMLKENGLTSVIAASDTYRAASIEQLQKHADNLGIKLIKHQYGSDAAAVAYDAVSYAKSKNIDAVLIDTAGRLHSNVNLMDELKKVNRIASPDLKVFVGESITGNDCVEQSQKFNETIHIDGIILSKADIDEKGGTALSVSYVTQRPIYYLGVGQDYPDLEKFNREKILDTLGLV